MTTDCKQPRLFGADEEGGKGRSLKQRRMPTRRRSTRGPSQRSLPVLTPEQQRQQRYRELADSDRPLTRGECCAEARPCPWVDCIWHLFTDNEERLRLFDAVMDRVDETAGDIEAEVARVVGSELIDGRYTPMAVLGFGEDGDLQFERILSDDVAGPLPTCTLDIADAVEASDKEVTMQDAGRAAGMTREGVRLLDRRVAPFFADAEALRPWLLEFVGKDDLEESAAEVEWYAK